MGKIGVRCVEVRRDEPFTVGKRYECISVLQDVWVCYIELVDDDGDEVRVLLDGDSGYRSLEWKSKFRFSIMPDVVGGVE